jgi:hypothetical protein
MKMLIKSMCVAGVVVCGASMSNANPFTLPTVTDPDAIGQNVSPQQPYHGTFNLTDAGYVPGTTIIDSADFSFQFQSDGTGWKQIEVGLQFGSGSLLTMIFPDDTPQEWNGTIPFTSQPAGGMVYYTITDIQPDNTFHNFKIEGAALTASGSNPNDPQVPDGGTALGLLGMGCMLVEGLRRRLAK